MIVVDTSGLLAAIDRSEDFHQATKALLDREQPKPNRLLLISPFVLAEVDYLLSKRQKRPDVATAVLRDVADEAYHLESFTAEDVRIAIQVMGRYSDQQLGLTDAANVVLARRHDTLDILTLDERHFRVLRGPGEKPFRLLPVDLE